VRPRFSGIAFRPTARTSTFIRHRPSQRLLSLAPYIGRVTSQS
jgi:hypothetical protein